MDYIERRTEKEYAYPVTIGEDCWIGGGAILCPGVTVGDRCIIGAGSVVTKDIPSDSIAVGNPAKVIRKNDRKILCKSFGNVKISCTFASLLKRKCTGV